MKFQIRSRGKVSNLTISVFFNWVILYRRCCILLAKHICGPYQLIIFYF